jgi:hypothetical protein
MQLMEGRLDLPRDGEVRATGSPSLPFVVVDASGCEVELVSRFLRGVVGTSGHCSGPHLHLEIHTGNPATEANAVDPVSFLRSVGVAVPT